MELIYNKRTFHEQASLPFGRKFGFFCRNNFINDFSFFTQDNRFIDLTPSFPMKTLIDINNKKISLTKRQYYELKSLNNSGKLGTFCQIGSFNFIPFRLIKINSRDSWLDIIEKLLYCEVMVSKKHVNTPLYPSRKDISFIDFYKDNDCSSPSDLKYFARIIEML